MDKKFAGYVPIDVNIDFKTKKELVERLILPSLYALLNDLETIKEGDKGR
jgi:hypothetical protein